MMHVEGDGSGATQEAHLAVTLDGISPVVFKEIAGKTVSQVSLSCPTRPRENQTSVLQQQAYVVQHHWFRNQRLKHQ